MPTRSPFALLRIVALTLVLTAVIGETGLSYAEESSEQQLAQYFPNLPADVKEHISRAENCQKYQWTAPPELSKSMRCNKVNFDNSRLVQKHEGKTDVIESLRLTRELYFNAE
jgi:hypothetical protein